MFHCNVIYVKWNRITHPSSFCWVGGLKSVFSEQQNVKMAGCAYGTDYGQIICEYIFAEHPSLTLALFSFVCCSSCFERSKLLVVRFQHSHNYSDQWTEWSVMIMFFIRYFPMVPWLIDTVWTHESLYNLLSFCFWCLFCLYQILFTDVCILHS